MLLFQIAILSSLFANQGSGSSYSISCSLFAPRSLTSVRRCSPNTLPPGSSGFEFGIGNAVRCPSARKLARIINIPTFEAAFISSPCCCGASPTSYTHYASLMLDGFFHLRSISSWLFMSNSSTSSLLSSNV